MNEHEPTPTSDEVIDAELTAYLDGEVDDAERAAIETRLSNDAAYRERLQGHQASLDLLDELTGCETDESFTRGTVAMAAAHLERPATARHGIPGWMVHRPWLIWATAIAASLLCGYAGLAIPTRIAHRHAEKEFALIKNYQLYYDVDSVEFLKLLDDPNLFGEEPDGLL